MKHAAALLLLSSLGLACAAQASDASAPNVRVVPVLVNLNAQGAVTNINPADRLAPGLMASLSSMVNSTAKKLDHSSQAGGQQILLNVQLTTSVRPDGNYNLDLSYVSAKQLPTGRWFWARKGMKAKLADMSAGVSAGSGTDPRWYTADMTSQPDRSYEAVSMDTRGYINNQHP